MQTSSAEVSIARGVGLQAAPSYYYLAANWRGQQNWYYCGPAAMQMALTYQGLYPSQGSLAAQAGTNSWDGTTVSGLMNTLNGQGNGSYWSWADLPSWPTSAQIEAFKASMMAGISHQYNHVYATVGDAWMVAGGPHLIGWDPNSSAFHYFTFRGYYDYARMVQYMDPYAGFGGNSIPQYATIDAVTVVNVMGGRGYAY